MGNSREITMKSTTPRHAMPIVTTISPTDGKYRQPGAGRKTER
jgi:hypothetical protein